MQPGGSSGLSRILKFWTLGVVLSAIAYGAVLTLFFACFFLLRRNIRVDNCRLVNKNTKLGMSIYIFIMFALSTTSVVYEISSLMRALNASDIQASWFLGANPTALCFVFANWGADGFLLWRCVILYDGISTICRRIILILISLMIILSLGAGILYLVTSLSISLYAISNPTFLTFAIITLFVNLLITSLVILRLMFFRRRQRVSLGNSHGSPYTGVISMCVESAALVILFSTFFLVLNIVHLDPFVFSRVFLIHIHVIAPFLIIYRVAQGKSSFTTTTPFDTRDIELAINRHRLSAMQFAEPSVASIVTMQSDVLPLPDASKAE